MQHTSHVHIKSKNNRMGNLLILLDIPMRAPLSIAFAHAIRGGPGGGPREWLGAAVCGAGVAGQGFGLTDGISPTGTLAAGFKTCPWKLVATTGSLERNLAGFSDGLT